MMSEKVPWEAGGGGGGRQRDSEMSTGVVGCLVAAGLINLIAGYSYCARVNLTGLRTAPREHERREENPG